MNKIKFKQKCGAIGLIGAATMFFLLVSSMIMYFIKIMIVMLK